MNYQKIQENYLQNQVLSASPNQLIELLMKAGIKNIKMAKFSIEKDAISEANTQLLKAQDIIMELKYSLDQDLNNDVVHQLSNLYDFMYQELITANLQKDAALLTPVEHMLEELLATWRQITVNKSE